MSCVDPHRHITIDSPITLKLKMPSEIFRMTCTELRVVAYNLLCWSCLLPPILTPITWTTCFFPSARKPWTSRWALCSRRGLLTLGMCSLQIAGMLHRRVLCKLQRAVSTANELGRSVTTNKSLRLHCLAEPYSVSRTTYTVAYKCAVNDLPAWQPMLFGVFFMGGRLNLNLCIAGQYTHI